MENTGQPMAFMDSFIIVTALQNNIIIATCNVTDFLPCVAQAINPWE
jgi:predicted nucleic acid-binding protein